MKALTLIFVVLIALLQYPLWLGKGSWLRVWDLSHQISKQQEKNNALKARNDTLDAEVRDLKSGRAAIEERARSELGMVKQDEVFYQVLEGPMPVIAPPPTAPVTAKTDTPIVISVPTAKKNPAAVTPATTPKPKPSLQPVNPAPPIEPAPAKKTEEQPRPEEKPKKVKPVESDAIEDAKAVLKQQ